MGGIWKWIDVRRESMTGDISKSVVYPDKLCIHGCFSSLCFVHLVVGIFLNKCEGFCRTGLDRAPEGLGVAGEEYVSEQHSRPDEIWDIPDRT